MLHPISIAAKKAGLTPFVIRAWEKRYGVVTPTRSQTQRRLYSDADVERLDLLRRVTAAGHPIGSVAKLPVEALKALAAEVVAASTRDNTLGAHARFEPTTMPFVLEAVEAIRSLNALALDRVLDRAVLMLGQQGLLRQVIAPLAQAVGELWRGGTLTAAHEHFASGLIRAFLASTAKHFVGGENAPCLLVATPVGQLHELGALLAGAAAANLGWQVIYLGASLPAAEIAGAALQNKARAVALSLVYPEDDPQVSDELQRLRHYLPPDMRIIVGGRATPAYSDALDRIGAARCADLAELDAELDRIRGHAPAPVTRPRSESTVATAKTAPAAKRAGSDAPSL